MVTTLLALLSSSGFGSVIGLIGGLLNRKLDISAKKIDHQFELDKMDKQKEYLDLEYKARIEIATKESDALVESHAYDALAESFKFAVPTSKDGWVDKFSKMIRPFLTLAFFFLTSYIFYKIHILVSAVGVEIPLEKLLEIYTMILSWIFFQGGVSIGWWFAMRPGKMPTLGGK